MTTFEPREVSLVLDYKGDIQFEMGYYYAPYRPGMSEEEYETVVLGLTSKTDPTEIQKRIMAAAKGWPDHTHKDET